MSADNGNGVIRIGRKGIKKFAFGDDGKPFEVEVVQAWQEWIRIDNEFRERTDDRSIAIEEMHQYHRAAIDFVAGLSSIPDEDGCGHSHPRISIAEALDFIARLREQYDEVADFFQPKSRAQRESPVSSGVEHQFSEESMGN